MCRKTILLGVKIDVSLIYSTEGMTMSEEETIDMMVENLTAKAMDGWKYRSKAQGSSPGDNEVLLAIQKSYRSIYEDVIEENKYVQMYSMMFRVLKSFFPESITVNLPDVKIPVEYYVPKTFIPSENESSSHMVVLEIRL
jgi:hypothetical protein